MPSDLTGLPAKRRAGSSENLLYLEALAAAAEASAAASPATVLKSPPSSRCGRARRCAACCKSLR